MSAAAVVASAAVPITVLVASYETLRRVALGRGGPDDDPSLGLAIVLRQGLAAWLRAWAMCPPRPVSVPRAAQAPRIPPILHTELARVWAHMALAHQEAAWM